MRIASPICHSFNSYDGPSTKLWTAAYMLGVLDQKGLLSFFAARPASPCLIPPKP